MKRILSIVALMAIVFSSNAFAVQRTATFGDKNSSNIYRMTATNDGVITFAQDTGIKYPYITATTTTTLTAVQTGTTLVVTPIQNNTRVNLPSATVGSIYIVIDSAAFSLAVYPVVGETINFASLTTSQGLTNSTTPAKGDALTLICSVAGKWDVYEMRNTWVAIAP